MSSEAARLHAEILGRVRRAQLFEDLASATTAAMALATALVANVAAWQMVTPTVATVCGLVGFGVAMVSIVARRMRHGMRGRDISDHAEGLVGATHEGPLIALKMRLFLDQSDSKDYTEDAKPLIARYEQLSQKVLAARADLHGH